MTEIYRFTDIHALLSIRIDFQMKMNFELYSIKRHIYSLVEIVFYFNSTIKFFSILLIWIQLKFKLLSTVIQ